MGKAYLGGCSCPQSARLGDCQKPINVSVTIIAGSWAQWAGASWQASVVDVNNMKVEILQARWSCDI